jgi:hypothetical protein
MADNIDVNITESNDIIEVNVSSQDLTNYVLKSELLQSTIIVQSAAQLSGTLSSSIGYIIDGSIDMGTTQIKVPSGGLFISGVGFGISELTSSANNYTMFVKDGVNYSGNLFMDKIEVSVTGTSSQVFNLDNEGNFGAVELNTVNFNNCTALGELIDYRQGLETNTGRFGGTPELTLSGTWSGGYFIDTSIVRSLTDGVYTLYKAGASFSMASRFRSNQNIDLPANVSFFNFSSINFVNPSTIQINGALVSRNGNFDSTDSNITPNIDQADIACAWSNNVGMQNTFEGGRLTVSSENLTTISSGSTWTTLNAIWASSNLEHFDSPSSGQLRHLGNSPREYKCTINFVIESQANNDLGIRLRKYDDSATSFIDFSERRRQVNSLVGGRDVAIFNFSFNVSLDQNDYVFFQVRNNSGNQNVTLELNSDWLLEER